jgi:hypothetical protein
VASLACGFFDYFRIGADRKQIPTKAVIDDKSLSIFARNVEQGDTNSGCRLQRSRSITHIEKMPALSYAG